MRASVGGHGTMGSSRPEKQHSPDGAREAARQATGKHDTGQRSMRAPTQEASFQMVLVHESVVILGNRHDFNKLTSWEKVRGASCLYIMWRSPHRWSSSECL